MSDVVNLSRDELVDAKHVLDDLAVAGVAVEVVGDRLRLRPASNVSEALKARAAASKAGILSLLATRTDELADGSLKLPPAVPEAARPALGDAETVEQARQRQAGAIERLRLDRLAYVEEARRAGVYRGLAINNEGGVG
jgi:hypothetical protein